MTAFTPHREEIDLRTWAQAHPQACFRRFAVEQVGDTSDPDVSSVALERVTETFEIVIAYPTSGRQRDRLGLHRQIASDLRYVTYYAGTNGFSVAPIGATIISDQWRREEGVGVVFGVIPLRVSYYRSPP